MCNNLTFLSNPVKRVQLLIHLTLWTFSVDSLKGEGYIEGGGTQSGISITTTRVQSYEKQNINTPYVEGTRRGDV